MHLSVYLPCNTPSPALGGSEERLKRVPHAQGLPCVDSLQQADQNKVLDFSLGSNLR